MTPDSSTLLYLALGAGLVWAVLPLIRWTAAVVAVGAGMLLAGRVLGVL